MRKTFLLILAVAFQGIGVVRASNNPLDGLERAGVRAAFVSTCVCAGAKLGEYLAIDMTTKAITSVVRNSNVLFDFCIGGAIRGKTLIQAVPVAASRGAVIGAATAGFVAPLLFDGGLLIRGSLKRSLVDLKTWIDARPNQAPVYVGVRSDYLLSGITTMSLSLSCVYFLSSIKQNINCRC